MLWIILFVLLSVAVEAAPPVAYAGGDQLSIPGRIVILDASQSYDVDGALPPSSYSWYEHEVLVGSGEILKLQYQQTGKHFITLKVVDQTGLADTDTMKIEIIEKKKCVETDAIYFPDDTSCQDAWPGTDGEIIFINSQEYSCNLVEICSPALDQIVVDAINCCTQEEPDQKKQSACQFARQHANKNAMKCEALYLIKGVGTHQIYMQGYFEAEMCCSGVSSLCQDPENFYTADPVPRSESRVQPKEYTCLSSPGNAPPGYWVSDIDFSRNNFALADYPAHVSLMILSTGTCVDSSFSITTLLRKLGYGKDDVFTVEAPTHAFNVVKFPLDKKYTVVDTTGTVADVNLGKLPTTYPYCENFKRCFSDRGQVVCPPLAEIAGCEGVKESTLKKVSQVQFTITDQVSRLFDAVLEEAKI